MVRHIVLWNYAENFTKEQNIENGKRIKAELESLKHLIDGVVSIQVDIDPLPSSNRDIVLDAKFISEEALANYINHPEHVRVGKLVRSVTCNRACFDYYE